jgi:aquaporin Z
MLRACLAEFLGTFALVLAGTGAIVVNELTGSLTHLGVAACFGLAVFVIIETIGPVSGAHINPAVTLALAAAGRCRPSCVGPYVVCQFLGATIASAAITVLIPASTHSCGMTKPTVSPAAAFAIDFMLTAGLLLTILRFSTGPSLAHAGLAIGCVIGLEALVAGPLTGASMNPARSLGPAIVAGRFEGLWLYLVAPTLGALTVLPLHRFLQPPAAESS